MGLVSDAVGSRQRIGRYELLQRLATGGMAELFLAKASGIEGFEKIVALKRILPHLADDAEFVRMFLREARLAATLDHANIVHVHDIGKEDGEYFFTMEYVHGEDLRRVFRRAEELGRRITLEHALTIVSGITAGLHHAHEQMGFDGRPLGIVHRDVSPSNIILTYGGGVKLLDFGIAKAAARTNVSRLSTLKGKASYMSPEQCRGATLDRRSDVFAIAIVLQELLTMKPVYPTDNELLVMNRVARGEVPPITDAWPQCPTGLQQILSRALQREPAQRYATALAMQLDLERFAHDHRVMLSFASLGQFLHDMFGSKPYPWMSDAPPPSEPPEDPRSLTPTSQRAAVAATAKRERATVVPLHAEAPISQPQSTMISQPPSLAPGQGSTVKAPIDPSLAEVLRERAASVSTGSFNEVGFEGRSSPWRWAVGGFAIAAAVGAYALATRDEPVPVPDPVPVAAPSSGSSVAPAPVVSPARAGPTPAPIPRSEGPTTTPAATPTPSQAGAPTPVPIEPDGSEQDVVEIEPEDEPRRRVKRGGAVAPRPRKPKPRAANPDPDGLLPY